MQGNHSNKTPSPNNPPLCPVCNFPTHFSISLPDERYSSLYRDTFVCNFGHSSEYLIAKKE